MFREPHALARPRACRRSALVFGSSTAGGAYLPGMSDYVVMVKERAKVFLGGPPLVKMATGEDADDEELGGAEMHARRVRGSPTTWRRTSATRCGSGAASWRGSTGASAGPARALRRREPRYDPDELLGIAVGRPASCRSRSAR